MTSLAVTLTNVTSNARLNLRCQHCGTPFEAKRSDAKFHNAACRQAAYRRQRDPIASPIASIKERGDGSWDRKAVEKLNRFVFSRAVGSLNARYANAPAAIDQADDRQLAEWNQVLTETIQPLSKIRQAVRAEQASRRRA